MHEAFVLGFFFIVVGVPVLASLYKRHLQFRERQLELMSTETAEKAARSAAHAEQLEQRVRVLERIATDKGVDVAEEIERLRDTPPLN